MVELVKQLQHLPPLSCAFAVKDIQMFATFAVQMQERINKAELLSCSEISDLWNISNPDRKIDSEDVYISLTRFKYNG